MWCINIDAGETFSLFIVPFILQVAYMSKRDKVRYSSAVPESFYEVMAGTMLGGGSLNINGTIANFAFSSVIEGYTQAMWELFSSLHLVISPYKTTVPKNLQWNPVYSFVTLTMPVFTSLIAQWYSPSGMKILPSNIKILLTPLALAHWIMESGNLELFPNGEGRITLTCGCFIRAEVQMLQDALYQNFGFLSVVHRTLNADPKRGYVIRIRSRHLYEVRKICAPHMISCMTYKLGY